MSRSVPFHRIPQILLLSAALFLLSGDISHQPPRAVALPPLEQTSEGGGFVPGELLVKPARGAFGLSAELAMEYPVALKEELAPLGVLRLGVPEGRELEIIGLLRSDPRVEWAEPNHVRTLMAVPDDRLYRQFQWNLRQMQMEKAWEISTGSQEVLVAVLDTGIDRSHPDLEGKLLPGRDMLNDDPNPEDDSGHGTHKAGVIGALSNNGTGVAGISWGARILPVKVLNSSGVGPDSVIARGITYAADEGARVINMSFGSSTSSQLLADAVRYATQKGSLLVAAAGNTARVDNAVIYPAAYPQVLAVAATDENDEVADFSQHHSYVGISAPGVHIVSTFWRDAGYGSYVSSSGTSDAAPHVSGLAALIWSVNPGLSPAQVKKIIQDTAEDLGTPGNDEYYGTGRINAYKALLAARPSQSPPTPAPVPTPAPPVVTPGPAPAPATLPRTVWYFAEGSTAAPFDLWLLIQNPNAAAVTARVSYMKSDGSVRLQEVWLPPVSRKSIYVNQLIPDAELSMKVESSALVFAERAMYFGRDGHDAVGVTSPSRLWYMAEGSTREGFDSWILLQNPLELPTSATVTFLTSDGQRRETELTLPPTSRRSIFVNQLLPEADFSTMVASDQPIIAERAMYFRQGGGHGSMGATQSSRVWYLAEGIMDEANDSWILVMNPNQSPANLKVTFMGEDGNSTVGYYSAAPFSRFSLHANDVVPRGRHGAQVESDQPVVVERSSYFAEGAAGHNSVATPLLAQEWYLPEGSTRQPFSEVIAILNPNDQVANLMVFFMKMDGGVETRYFAARPNSRVTLNVNELMPDAELSTKVVSDIPVAVERSMYFAGGRGGTSSFGIPR